MKRFWAILVVTVVGALGFSSPASAQYYQRMQQHTDHHHHDPAGHRVDDQGHHIDTQGHHTGGIGVYDNGHADIPQYRNYIQPQYVQPSYIQPSYVQPSYVQPSYVQPGYAQPSTTTLRPLGVPQNTRPGVGNLNVQHSGEEIVISSPQDSGQAIQYAVGEYQYSIKPGYKQRLTDDRTWVIAFGSGGSRGDIRYTLSPGTYEFRDSGDGWDLVKLRSEPIAADLPPPAPFE